MEYPEHEKLGKIKEQSQICGEFVDWLNTEKEISLCSWSDEDNGLHYPTNIPLTKLLSDFFGIDQDKLEEEKLQILENHRKLTQKS